MALFAEARRLVMNVYRLSVVHGTTSLQSTVSHRSRSINRQLLCVAVIPYSTRESCSLRLADTERTQILMDKSDRIVHTDTDASSCLIDGDSLDRLFGLNKTASEGEKSKHQTYFTSPNTQTFHTILDKVILRGLGYDESLQPFDQLSNTVNTNTSSGVRNSVLDSSILFCDSQAASESHEKSNHDRGLPTTEELSLIKQHLESYIPEFFRRSHNYKIYTTDLIFENNYEDKHFVTDNINAYVLYIAKKRAFAQFKYANVVMHALKITQHEEDGTVRIRWRVTGLPQFRVFLFWKYLPWTYRANLKDDSEWIDGFSTFYVQPKTGLIYKHVVDKVIVDGERIPTKRVKFIDRLRKQMAGAVA